MPAEDAAHRSNTTNCSMLKPGLRHDLRWIEWSHKQELATNKEIGEFCLLTYNVDFPMVEKTSVAGAAADPLYKQLNEATGQPPQVELPTSI